MGREFKEIDIDGVPYRIGQVGARKARDISLRLVEVHGDVLAALNVDLDAHMPANRAAAALGRSMAAMAKAYREVGFWNEIVEPLFGCLLSNGRQVIANDLPEPARLAVYEDLFTGRLSHEMNVLKACVEHNCGDFIAAFADQSEITRVLHKLASKAESPSPPTDTPERP